MAVDAEKSFNQAEALANENKESFEAGEARYLSGVASLKQGKTSQAEQKVQSLQDARGYQDFIADSFDNYETNGRQSFLNYERNRIRKSYLAQEPKNSFRAAIETGYDSNVSLLPDSAAPSSGSAFQKPVFGFSHSRYVAGAPLEIFASVSLINNMSSAARTSNSIPLSVGAEWRLPGDWGRKHHVSLVGSLNRVYLTHPSTEEFLTGGELALQKAYYLENDQQILVSVPISYNRYPTTSGADDRTGASFGLKGEHFHRVGLFHISENLGYTRDNTEGDNFKADDWSVGGGIGLEPWSGMKTRVVLNYNYLKYPSNSLDRTDSKIGAAAVLDYKVHQSVNATLTLNFVNNRSNVDIATYSKSVVSASASYAF